MKHLTKFNVGLSFDRSQLTVRYRRKPGAARRLSSAAGAFLHLPPRASERELEVSRGEQGGRERQTVPWDSCRASGYVTWHKDTGRCVLWFWLCRGRRMATLTVAGADGSGPGQNRQTGESR